MPAATWAEGEVLVVVVCPRRWLPAGVTAEVPAAMLVDDAGEVPPDEVPPDEGAELAVTGPSLDAGCPRAVVPRPRRPPCVAVGTASGGLAGTVVVVAAAVRGGNGAWAEVGPGPLLGGELE